VGEAGNGLVRVDTAVGPLYAPAPESGSPAVAATVWLSVRPERIAVSAAEEHQAIAARGAATMRNRLRGMVRHVLYKGGLSDVTIALADGTELRAALAAGDRLDAPHEVTISWPAEVTRLLCR
jgi:hypothetical protein